MLKEVLEFAQKLSGAWQTTDKSLAWFFDAPDVDSYPNWKFHVKHEALKDFVRINYLLYSPTDNIYRLQYGGPFGLNEYKLNFWDDSILEASKLLNGEVVSEILHRVSTDDIESFFKCD